MSLFLPKMYQKSIYDINYDKLLNKKIKVLLFDMDNTCLEYHSDKVSMKLKNLFNQLKKKGFDIYLFSNSIKREKVKRIAIELGVSYNYFSMKPLKGSFQRIKNKSKCTFKEMAIIGDQLFTDILGGNRIGVFTILVIPINDKELWTTKVLRKFEQIIFENMKKKGLFDRDKYYD